jgi:ribonuclease HI
MYFDDSFTLNGAGGGVVLVSPKGDQILYVTRLHFRATNNVVEYEAPSMAYASPQSSGSSGSTFVVTLSSSSTRSWGSRIVATPHGGIPP